MSNYLKIALFFILLACVLAMLNIRAYLDTPSNNHQAIDIVIERGSSVKRIGKELAKFDIIKHPKLFVIAKKIFFPRYILKAGEYEIPPHATIRNIIEIIHKGDVVIHKLTVQEGITTKEVIDKILEQKSLVGNITREFKEGDFIANTYYYTYGESRMALLDRMHKCSIEVIDELWEKRALDLPFKTKQEAMVLASIIEKETGIASERPQIAGVFINRLRKKMKLQADPTVIYAVTQGKYILDHGLTRAELKIDSPYNTYLYPGLPPMPIANPGKASLEAALNPMVTKDLYFVVNGQGGHNFSATLSSHNSHVNTYRKGAANNVK